jgi:large-conductance mechanosensitive channel
MFLTSPDALGELPMHDSSAMPFVHLALIAGLIVAFAVFVVVTKMNKARDQRRKREHEGQERQDV